MTLSTVQVLIASIDLIVSDHKPKGDDGSVASTEFSNIYLDSIQITLAFLVIFMLNRYQAFLNKLLERDDPFSNGNLLAFIVYCVVI